MFLACLQESSIHGLRHLAQARNPVARLFWLVLICSCVVSAAVIIFYNVRNWQNSPVMVTLIQTDLAKGKNFMPMVTVCPRQPNPSQLLFSLLSENPDLVTDAHLATVKRELAVSMAARQQQDREGSFYTLPSAFKALFSKCDGSGDETSTAAACQLVLLLSEISKLPGYDTADPKLAMWDFVGEAIATGTRPTLDNVRDFFESRYEVAMGNGGLGDYPDYAKIAKLYTAFFPVFENKTGGEFVSELRGLDSYVLPQLEFVDRSDYPSFLTHLNDRGYLSVVTVLPAGPGKIKVAMLDLVLDSIKTYLGVEDLQEAYEMVNAFSYDPGNRPFLVRNGQAYELACGRFSNDNFTITDMCQQAGIDETCSRYCKSVVQAGDKKQQLVRKLFAAASEVVGPLTPGNPLSLLPVCQRSDGKFPSLSDNCWRRVVNERGVCFSTWTNNSAITGSGDDHGFQMAVDLGELEFSHPSSKAGDSSAEYEFTRPKYDVAVTAPNHFSVGELVNEKHAVAAYNADNAAARRVTHFEVDLISVTESTEEFRGMSPTRRRRLYPEERTMKHFPLYSRPNCVLECAWERAAANCGCVPWFLASDSHPDGTVCEAHGNACFKSVVDDRYEQEEGCFESCLAECDRAEYDVSLTMISREDNYYSTEAVKTHENQLYYDHVMETKYENAPKQVLNVLDSMQSKSDLGVNLTLQRHVGLVKVSVGKKTTLKITLTATMTLVDMISNVGGTLGLFMGFSLLSGAEIFYWVAANVLVGRRRRRGPLAKKNKKKKKQAGQSID